MASTTRKRRDRDATVAHQTLLISRSETFSQKYCSPYTMKVIVAGYPKTGTTTLHAALETLGYNVYDFLENTDILRKEWLKIFRDGWTTEDFRKMYENVDAVVDQPPCYFWEEIHEAFPDAKIILTTRNEEEWYKSFLFHRRKFESDYWLKLMAVFSPIGRTAFGVIFNFYTSHVIYGVNDELLWKPFRKMKMNEQLIRKKYRAHNAYVLQNAPPDQLLVYSVTEGWEPLCKFLNKPIPDKPFPHKNKRTRPVVEAWQYNPLALEMLKEVKISLATITIISGVVGFFVYTKGPRNLYNSAMKMIASKIDHLILK